MASGWIRRVAQTSPSVIARMVGVSFLVTMLTAVVTEFLLRGQLGFAGTVATSILEISGMAGLTLFLYILFRPVSAALSLLAAAVNVIGLALEALQWQPGGVGVGLVLHGVYWLLIGCLIFRSTFLPRILSLLMLIAGLGWMTYLSMAVAEDRLAPYNLAAALTAEAVVMLWLLVIGVNVPRWNRQSAVAGATHTVALVEVPS
jgi:hypothetical protein